MSTKLNILKILEQNMGNEVSGELIAKSVGVTRAGVWKAISALKQDGYLITAATNRGYSLDMATDILSPEGILPYLDHEVAVIVHKVVESTNLCARQLALDGAAHGTTVLALEQTAGKGRLGRTFESPLGTGIYMSMVLRLGVGIGDAVMITTAASVAVCRAIETLMPDKTPKIKWVNDIYIEGKKLCGIWTEGVTNFESGTVDSIVLGIGINFDTKISEFSEAIRDNVTSLFPSSAACIKKNRLIAQVINEVISISKEIVSRDFINEYKSKSLVLGEQVTVFCGNDTFEATAIDIDQNGGLIVKNEVGQIITLSSGEITIRLAKA